MTLSFTIKEQIISRYRGYNYSQRIVSDSKNYLKAQFTFMDKQWYKDNSTITAIFSDGLNTFHVLANKSENKNNEYTCMVPPEVLHPGTFSVSCFAGDRITTNKEYVEVEESGYASGKPSEATPDIYAQIFDSINEVKKIAQEANSRREALDLSAYSSENNAKDITTIPNGAYDIVGSGFICAHNHQNNDGKCAELSAGSFLYKNDYYATFIFNSMFCWVDTEGSYINEWGEGGLIIPSQVFEQEYKPRVFKSKSISSSDWTANTGISPYSYKAEISNLNGISQFDIINIVWRPDANVVAGKLSNYAVAGNNKITVYATENNISATVDSIVAFKY